MKPPKQKIIIIYHGGCRDGFGGAWAAWKKFGNRAAYLPAFDRFAPPCKLKNKEVYLIDYTYREDLVRKLTKENVCVTAIDHHITSERAAKLTEKYSFDLHHSGAVLAWNYFHPRKKVPMLLRYVEDSDLWRFVVPRSKEILACIDLSERDFRAWDQIAKELENGSRRKIYAERGGLILSHEAMLMKEMLTGAELVRFAGHKIFALNASHHFNSDLGHILAKKTNSFGLVWYEVSGRIQVSLRSTGSVDVSKIAQRFNGGGHKKSAGFSFAAGKKFPWKLISASKRK